MTRRLSGLLDLKLKKAGFGTLTAHDSSSAMEVLSKHHVDLIISDIRMPGTSGFEFCKKDKRSSLCCLKPFALISFISCQNVN